MKHRQKIQLKCMENNIELTQEKSEQQAVFIREIGNLCCLIDPEYLKAFAAELSKKAKWNASTAALNANFDPAAVELMHEQVKAVMMLVEYREQLIAIELKKAEVSRNCQHRKNIEDYFKQ